MFFRFKFKLSNETVDEDVIAQLNDTAFYDTSDDKNIVTKQLKKIVCK